MAREDKGGVEGLKRRLYARKNAPKPASEERTPLSQSEVHAPTSWSEIHAAGEGGENSDFSPGMANSDFAASPRSPAAEKSEFAIPGTTLPPLAAFAEPKKRMSFATKFLLGSIAFFVVASGVAAALFLGGVNVTSPQNITVDILAPSLIDGGKASTFEIIITNRNTTTLNLADLVIDYPDGTRDASDPTQSLSHQRISIGTINSGQQIKKTISAIFYGPEGTQETLQAGLEYSVSGSNAVFQKQNQAQFTIGSAPVSLTVDAPSQTTAGDQFTMTVTVRSNASVPVNNVAVEGQYPFGFSVTNSSPTGSAGGTFWRLGTMNPGDTKTIQITGSIDATDGDQRVFKFLVGSNSDTTASHVAVPFLTIPETLTVEKPFITGSISVDGNTGHNIAVAAGKTLQGSVNWQNNLTDSLSNLQLSLSFSGPAVDKNSINAQNGFYQSNNSTIIWSSDRDSILSSVAPGATGSYQFSFATLPPGVQNTLITNPTITLNLTVSAVRQDQSGSTQTLSSAASATLTLASQLTLLAQSTHSSGPFSNTGPVPPHAESATSYTITWTVKNSANTLANTSVKTVLPPYVNFISAQSGTGITYDAGSRTVTWSLGDVKPGVGYTASAQQASFQLTLIPSSSQVGTAPALTGPTTASGQDRFAQVEVDASADAPTTRTVEAISGMDMVVPK